MNIYTQVLLRALPKGWGRYGGRLVSGNQFKNINSMFNKGLNQKSMLEVLNRGLQRNTRRFNNKSLQGVIREIEKSRQAATRLKNTGFNKRPTDASYSGSTRNVGSKYSFKGMWTKVDEFGNSVKRFGTFTTDKRLTRKEMEDIIQDTADDIAERFNYSEGSQVEVTAMFKHSDFAYDTGVV